MLFKLELNWRTSTFCTEHGIPTDKHQNMRIFWFGNKTLTWHWCLWRMITSLSVSWLKTGCFLVERAYEAREMFMWKYKDLGKWSIKQKLNASLVPRRLACSHSSRVHFNYPFYVNCGFFRWSSNGRHEPELYSRWRQCLPKWQR